MSFFSGIWSQPQLLRAGPKIPSRGLCLNGGLWGSFIQEKCYLELQPIKRFFQAAKAFTYNVARDVGPSIENRINSDAVKLFAAPGFAIE